MAKVTYSHKTDLLRGSALSILIDGEVVAYTKTHKFDVKAEVESIMTKLSVDGKTPDKVTKSYTYSISIEALYSSNTQQCSADQLVNRLAAGTPIEWKEAAVTVTETGGKRTPVIGEIKKQGTAIITSVSQSLDAEGIATLSIEMEGTGALKDKAGNVIGSAAAISALGTYGGGA